MQKEAPFELVQKNKLEALRLVTRNRSGYYAAKRLIDAVVAGTLLVLLSPLMVLIAALIFIYSPGPIFFAQERVGARRERNGRYSYWKRVNFHCFKFRTMKVNADSSIHQAYVQALIAND